VHVVAGDRDLTQAILVPGQNGDDGDDAGPQHPAHGVPVGKIDIVRVAPGHGEQQVPRRHHQRRQKDQPHRPWPFAIFKIARTEPEIERDGARHRGNVEQP